MGWGGGGKDWGGGGGKDWGGGGGKDWGGGGGKDWGGGGGKDWGGGGKDWGNSYGAGCKGGGACGGYGGGSGGCASYGGYDKGGGKGFAGGGGGKGFSGGGCGKGYSSYSGGPGCGGKGYAGCGSNWGGYGVWQPMFNPMMKGFGKGGLRTFANDRKVFIGGLPPDNCSVELNKKLKEHMCTAGPVCLYAEVARNGSGGAAFKSSEDAAAAIEALNGSVFDGITLSVDSWGFKKLDA